jgi:hypothetical protein
MVFLLLTQKPNDVIVRRVDGSFLVVSEAEVEVEDANVVNDFVNDDVNINIVGAKVIAITKVKLQALAIVVHPVATVDGPVVEVIQNIKTDHILQIISKY